MGDIYVHLRMKECCRSTLKDLDERKRKVKMRSGLLAVPSLFEALSEKPIVEARNALPVGDGVEGGAGEMDRLVRAACEKTCVRHAEEHEGKGEKTEGAFWRDAALSTAGKLEVKSVDPTQGSATAAPATPKTRAQALKSAADEALQKHPNACNQSTAMVAETMGHSELNGQNANQQIDYMDEKWRSVDARTAQDMANQGDLVIAGHKGDGHGHTTVVVPGDGTTKGDGGFYPNVEGGALGGIGSGGYSDGSKTAGDVWNRNVRRDVKYYVPK